MSISFFKVGWPVVGEDEGGPVGNTGPLVGVRGAVDGSFVVGILDGIPSDSVGELEGATVRFPTGGVVLLLGIVGDGDELSGVEVEGANVPFE